MSCYPSLRALALVNIRTFRGGKWRDYVETLISHSLHVTTVQLIFSIVKWLLNRLCDLKLKLYKSKTCCYAVPKTERGNRAVFQSCPMLPLLTLLLLHDIIQSGSDWPSDVLRHYSIPLISPPVRALRKPVYKIVIPTLRTCITCLHRIIHVALCYFSAVISFFFSCGNMVFNPRGVHSSAPWLLTVWLTLPSPSVLDRHGKSEKMTWRVSSKKLLQTICTTADWLCCGCTWLSPHPALVLYLNQVQSYIQTLFYVTLRDHIYLQYGLNALTCVPVAIDCVVEELKCVHCWIKYNTDGYIWSFMSKWSNIDFMML